MVGAKGPCWMFNGPAVVGTVVVTVWAAISELMLNIAHETRVGIILDFMVFCSLFASYSRFEDCHL